jgi:hypothetical protein
MNGNLRNRAATPGSDLIWAGASRGHGWLNNRQRLPSPEERFNPRCAREIRKLTAALKDVATAVRSRAKPAEPAVQAGGEGLSQVAEAVRRVQASLDLGRAGRAHADGNPR